MTKLKNCNDCALSKEEKRLLKLNNESLTKHLRRLQGASKTASSFNLITYVTRLISWLRKKLATN